MDGFREALLRMYRVAIQAKRYSESFRGYVTPYTDIYEGIADAIYYMIGENTETFEESTTYHVLNNEFPDEKSAVQMLMNRAAANSFAKPHTFSREEMGEMYRLNGGYLHTPEGEWT